MKKIIALFTLTLAFGFTANAQQNLKEAPTQQLSTKEIIIKNVENLNTVVKLDNNIKSDIVNLLSLREETLANTRNEEERKAIFEKFGQKLQSVLTSEQVTALKKNKELYSTLMVYTSK